MTLLEITVQRKAGETWPVVVEHSRPDSISPIRTESELRLSDDDFSQFIQREIDPRGYGKVLGRALFSGLTREAFLKARARDPEGLRVLLFVEDKALQRLYWGRLCAPVEEDWWDFLLLDQRAAFSLFLPSTTGRTYRPIGSRDLRALLLVAKPDGLDEYGLDDFDAPATVGSLRRALDPIPCDVLAAVPEADGLPTLDELSRRLTEGQDTILHVVAHGQVKGDETYLYLADSENKVERVAGEALIRELRQVERLPHLVFLATCHSAQPKAGLGGLAQRLVSQLGMPAAVAMSESVSIDTAEALATTFYRELRIDGRPDTALAKACAGLTRRHDVTAPGLYSRLGGRPLFSDKSDRELTDNEIEFGLTEFEALLPKRAPVLQEEFSKHAGRLRGMLGAGRENLSKAARDEWDQALAWMNAASEEVLDLSFPALALGKEPPHYDARCPFPGLLAFGSRFATSGKSEDDDREFFFGRDELVKQLVKKLQAHPFLAVLGGSGSGKSSLVLAGLVPALKKKPPTLRMAYMTPGGDPHARLDAALGTDTSTGQPVPPDPRPPSGVGPLSCILVVDQFEELFRLTRDPNTRQAFVQRLLALTKQHAVVLTMRADFWGDCFPYPALRDAMLAHQVPIAPMTSAELRGAMEQQAAAVGLRFEADLSNTILDAVEGEPGSMPLLQHLLLEMWKRRHGRWLRASEYRALGGIKLAIAHTADRIYAALSPAEQATVRNIFVRLTRLDEEAILGQERRDTRRRVALAELVPARQDPVPIRSLVHRLADVRLVVVNPAEEVEVAHEALIRYWPTLQTWIDQDRQSLLLHGEVSQAAEAWGRTDRDDYLLHRGTRLHQVVALRTAPAIDLNSQELAYIRACEESAQGVLHITIYPKLGDTWPVGVDLRLPGAIWPAHVEGQFVPDAAIEQLEGASADPLLYGEILGRGLFSGSVLAAFLKAWAAGDEQLRVTLFVESWGWRSAHWESLCAPFEGENWRLLATEASVAYSFYLPSSVEHGLTAVDRDEVRALVLSAKPTDLEKYGFPSEYDEEALTGNLLVALGSARCDVLGRIEGAVGPPTVDTLRDKLAERPYEILHLDVNGDYRRGPDDTFVLFTKPDGTANRVSGSELIRQLATVVPQHRPRFVFLAFVNSASPAAPRGRGLAQRFVRDLGIPAVIGTAGMVTLRTYETMVGLFYGNLLKHGAVDRALAEARSSIGERDTIDGLVLYSRLEDGELLPDTTQVGTPTPQVPAIEITIAEDREGQDGWPMSVRYSRGGDWLWVRVAGELQLELARLTDVDNAREYGAFLGQALFEGPLRTAWTNLRHSGPLRVSLSVEASQLKTLRWEWLCGREEHDTWRFLAETPGILFSLHVKSAVAASTRCRARSSLAVLSLVAGGDSTKFGLPAISVDAVQSSLARALGDLPIESVFTISSGDGLSTLEALRKQCRTGKYDILHIVAHGARAKSDGDFAVFLPDQVGELRPVVLAPDRRLPQLAGANELPAFAFLCPPERASRSGAEALDALAQEFVERAGMLAALAFTTPVSLELSEAFATAFYRQLRAHGEVDRALNEACIALAGRSGFAPPALYTRLKGKRLFYEA